MQKQALSIQELSELLFKRIGFMNGFRVRQCKFEQYADMAFDVVTASEEIAARIRAILALFDLPNHEREETNKKGKVSTVFIVYFKRIPYRALLKLRRIIQ